MPAPCLAVGVHQSCGRRAEGFVAKESSRRSARGSGEVAAGGSGRCVVPAVRSPLPSSARRPTVISVTASRARWGLGDPCRLLKARQLAEKTTLPTSVYRLRCNARSPKQRSFKLQVTRPSVRPRLADDTRKFLRAYSRRSDKHVALYCRFDAHRLGPDRRSKG
jgi:hypothetical protein